MTRSKRCILAIAITFAPILAWAKGSTLFQPSIVGPVDPPDAVVGPVLRTGTIAADRGALESQDQVTLRLFSDVTFVARRVGREERGPLGYAWFGAIQDPAGGRVTAIVTPKGVTAEIRSRNRVFLVFPTPSGTHVVHEIDARGYPPETCLASPSAGAANGSAVPGHASPALAPSEAGAAPSAMLACPSPPPPPPPGEDIDVLVVYTDDVAETYGDVPAMVQLAVEVTNHAYLASLVHQRLRLLDVRMVTYDESGNPLGDLANPSHPELGIVDAWREECGADLVDMWTLTLGSSCGIAYVKGSACEDEVFSVTRVDCAIGNYSFAHELGHNMGAQHNHEDAGSSAAYPFSYGLRVPEAGFRTIMAYDSGGCCQRIEHFSNPNVCVPGPGGETCVCGTPGCYATGIPAGQPGAADNAQTLNLTAQLVAAQRTATGACLAYSCLNDAECEDGLFCNGHATCVNQYCSPGTSPCPQLCRESDDTCVSCLSNADCDDALFCNGVETCDAAGTCQFGTNPCEGQSCKEPTNTCTAGAQVWMSFIDKATIPGVGNVENEDIVARDAVTGAWSLIFDGSDVGLSSLTIDGMAVLSSGDILLSFTDAKSIPGMTGGPSGTTLDDSDIVRFVPTSLGATTSGSFAFYFDGSDVGLTTNDEDIDAISLNAIGQLVISTVGPVTANGVSGADTDLLLFSAASLGAATSGTFSMYIDGSDVGLTDGGNEDVDACGLTPDRKILLSTVGPFSVPGVAGDDEDLLRLQPTAYGDTSSGNYTMYLDLSTVGIATSEDVGAVEYLP